MSSNCFEEIPWLVASSSRFDRVQPCLRRYFSNFLINIKSSCLTFLLLGILLLLFLLLFESEPFSLPNLSRALSLASRYCLRIFWAFDLTDGTVRECLSENNSSCVFSRFAGKLFCIRKTSSFSSWQVHLCFLVRVSKVSNNLLLLRFL